MYYKEGGEGERKAYFGDVVAVHDERDGVVAEAIEVGGGDA